MTAPARPGAVGIAIPPHLLAAMYAHALAEFPAECCGYLTGPADAPAPPDAAAAARDVAAPRTVDAIVTCRNAQADGEHPIAPERGADTGFVIAGAELFAFARSFDGPAPARVVYHSHTNGRAYLSDVDRTLAETPDGPAYPVEHVVIGVGLSGAPDGGPDTAPRVIEVAQYAWKKNDRSFFEVARWTP